MAQLIVRGMRALAQFIMRGRWPAATVALLGSWFPIVTPATVSLVALRCGAVEGFVVMLWAILPAAVALWASDLGALMAYATMAVMLVVLIGAVHLRSTQSWPRTLMVVVASSTLVAVGLALSMDDLAASLTETLGDFAVPQEPAEGEADPVPLLARGGQTATAGMVAYLIAFSSAMGLLAGRWWQALLYNPGGFQAEFHNLRMPPVAALASAGAALYCLAAGAGYQTWANVFSLPLVLAGIGLVHCWVKQYRLGLPALVAFYIVLLLVLASPVVLILATLAFADVWVNFRSRFKSTQ